MKVSIVLVNFNGYDYLNQCLLSIKEHISCEYEVILVDNASSDASVELIKTEFPWVKLVESTINYGFTGGNNLGAQYATGDIILLLNTDTVTLTDISIALEYFSSSDLGVLGCRMWFENKGFQPSIGYEHNPLRIILFWSGIRQFIKSSWLELTNNTEECYRTDMDNVAWVSGAWLMTRKELWDDIGGLDESYFMYVEDVDFCKNIRKNGYRVAYCSDIEIIHLGGGGKAWGGTRALIYTGNSYVIYLNKHYGLLPMLITSQFVAVLWIIRGGGYLMLSFITNNLIAREKAKGYLVAGFNIWKQAFKALY